METTREATKILATPTTIAGGCFVRSNFTAIEDKRMQLFEEQVPNGLKGFPWKSFDIIVDNVTLK
jgi:hypothetical protein